LYSHILIDALFVLAVTLIWFMLAYQSVLFFLGHRYYRQTKRSDVVNKSGDSPAGRSETRFSRVINPDSHRSIHNVSHALNDDDLPEISILIPCRNEERVIENTLRAMVALAYPPEKLEILIVNDGSTDATGAIARRFTADPRVRLLEVPAEKAGRGKAAALNFGLGHARHSVLAVYDADNTPESGALRPLVEELVLDPGLGAAVGMYRAVNRHRNLLTRFLNIEGIGFQWIVQAGRWALMRFATLPGTNYVIRRRLVEELGGWDEGALTEDAELTLRVYQAGYQIKFVPESVTWEQEPESLRVWFRQRHRWVRGYNYLLRQYAGRLWRMKPRRIGLELLYSLWLYYVFFVAIVVSDILFVLSASGVIRIAVPGPYSVVWFFAYVTFVLQLVIALAAEREEDSLPNILLTMLMYFTYCQLWIPVVARAFYDDFILRKPAQWAKTERFETSASG